MIYSSSLEGCGVSCFLIDLFFIGRLRGIGLFSQDNHKFALGFVLREMGKYFLDCSPYTFLVYLGYFPAYADGTFAAEYFGELLEGLDYAVG